jgi:hypothetical protein
MSNNATFRASLILFALLLSAGAQQQTITGNAVGVSDGDTIPVLDLSNCPDYSRIAERNRVPFKSEAEAQAAGYRKARNCPQ